MKITILVLLFVGLSSGQIFSGGRDTTNCKTGSPFCTRQTFVTNIDGVQTITRCNELSGDGLASRCDQCCKSVALFTGNLASRGFGTVSMSSGLCTCCQVNCI